MAQKTLAQPKQHVYIREKLPGKKKPKAFYKTDLRATPVMMLEDVTCSPWLFSSVTALNSQGCPTLVGMCVTGTRLGALVCEPLLEIP